MLHVLMDGMQEDSDNLGLGLAPGDHHYRAYVGPPEDYDLVAAMTFNLLTTLGLRQGHSLLDVGCGSLRVGRLLIPYLNRRNYVGIEPNRWLVEEGVAHEIGESLLEIKEPQFIYTDSPSDLASREGSFDFVVAQSIFSHCGWDLMTRWLRGISACLRPSGALVATFIKSDIGSERAGWIYPDCVAHTEPSLREAASAMGFTFEILDWKHPRQTWALFARELFDTSWFEHRPLTWNTMVAAAARGISSGP